jgi:hypothetical protein
LTGCEFKLGPVLQRLQWVTAAGQGDQECKPHSVAVERRVAHIFWTGVKMIHESC